MSDQPPSHSGVDDTADGDAGDTPPAVPAIDLSKPEEPAPSSTVDSGPLVSAPDAEPLAPPPMPPAADTPPAPPVPPASVPPAPPPAPESSPEKPGTPKGQTLKLALLVVFFIAVVVVAYVLGKSGGGGDEPIASSTTSTTIDDTPVNTSTWETFTDDASGFSIKHPDDWERLPLQGAERLFLQGGPSTAAQVTVRNISEADAPAVIQEIIKDAELVEEPADFQLSGAPAIVYIFRTPINEDSPDPGLAVQYFVVSPNKLYSIVFVTRPPEELNRLGRIFNAVAASFKITNANPAPEPAPTPTTGG